MTYKKVHCRYICVLLALLLLVSVIIGGRYISSAFADTGRYTSALADLQKDESFNAADFPDDPTDYSIRVIQIAESADGELLVYTYQPCQKTLYLVATEINMSLSESTDNTRLYGLTLVKSDGVFCKYIVNGFTVGKDAVRYYNITSIYRDWIYGIDEKTNSDNIKNAVAFDVGKLYRAITENGVISYTCLHKETIQIVNPIAGFLEYREGFKLYGSWCDSHYVAFSTDRQIDTLMEADVSFVYCRVDRNVGSGKDYYDESTRENMVRTLSGEQKGGNVADGLFAKKYEWKRIQSVDEFKETENLTYAAIKNLDGAQWVLRFCETERRQYWGDADRKPSVTTSILWQIRGDISEVSILRLKFITNGKVYNLGAVSDKVTEGKTPGNNNTNEIENIFDWLSRVTGVPEWVWKLTLALIVIAIFLPILSLIFPVFGQLILTVIKGIVWLVCLPFRGIAALIQKIRERGAK